MSINELRHFFPSATHPALPIAGQILSSLRNLTGPEKGNNLRPEERTALVGVAALLGCEKIQNKDLNESSAQKASHASPAHFRSALALSRKLLASSPSSSPSRSAIKTRKSSKEAEGGGDDTDNGESSSTAAARAAALSPFSTPRKKWRPASSGVDLSGLNSRGYSPSKGSPLKQSLTPTQRDQNNHQSDVQPSSSHEDNIPEDNAEIQITPSKKAAVSNGGRRSSRRLESDTSAFFALRPGSMITPPDLKQTPITAATRRRERSISPTPRREVALSLSAKRKRSEHGKRRKRIKQIDWTFREDIWAKDELRQKNTTVLRGVLEALPDWLSLHDLPTMQDSTTDRRLEEFLPDQFAAIDEDIDMGT